MVQACKTHGLVNVKDRSTVKCPPLMGALRCQIVPESLTVQNEEQEQEQWQPGNG